MSTTEILERNDEAAAHCENCGWVGLVSETNANVHNYGERVDLDETGNAIYAPCGECPQT